MNPTAYPCRRPNYWTRFRVFCSNTSNELGRLTGSSEYQKSLGSDLQLNEYQFDYEQYSVQVQLANFVPRGGWQVQGVRLV